MKEINQIQRKNYKKFIKQGRLMFLVLDEQEGEECELKLADKQTPDQL